jgi:hypothetical protein
MTQLYVAMILKRDEHTQQSNHYYNNFLIILICSMLYCPLTIHFETSGERQYDRSVFLL